MSSAACASSMVCSSESAAPRVCDPATSRQCPNERNPIFFTLYPSAEAPVRIPSVSTRLPTRLPATYAHNEGTPFSRSEAKNGAIRVLTIPDVNKRPVRCRDLKAIAAPVAPGAPSPHADRAISIIADIVTTHNVLLRASCWPRSASACRRITYREISYHVRHQLLKPGIFQNQFAGLLR